MLIEDTNIIMDNKRKQPDPIETETASKQRRVLTLRDLIPPKKINHNTRAVRVGDIIRAEYFPTIVPEENDLTTLDWTAVIARARSHPHEAGESYFVRSTSPSDGPAAIDNELNDSAEDTIMTYKPLHAMLKYDPPLSAVEAVLKAYPYAALDQTFEGTALKIAAESKVSTMPILRLLLVAEMAMRKKVLAETKRDQQQQQQQQEDDNAVGKADDDADQGPQEDTNIDLVSVIPSPSSTERLFVGHNPIRWISEPHIPRKTAGLLLKWYPVGAFQRPRDEDGVPFEEIEQDYHDEDAMYSDSPLIEIIDDFGSDQDVHQEDQDNEVNDDSESEDGLDSTIEPGHSVLPRRRRTFAEREYLRKERRWEKLLHIIYAADKILMSLKTSSGNTESAASSNDKSETSEPSKLDPSTGSSNMVFTERTEVTRFHPVHAWIRIITNPNLGLEICRPYGVWSILRAMGQRIPSEFAAKDESDGNRTVFQTLVENKASDCRLCIEEIRDLVECLMDADYRSVHLPRQSDGRLIAHVALENGWPCRDLFSRKTSATCA